MHKPGAPADDAGMQALSPNPVSVPDVTVRCECTRCGAHVQARRSWRIAGWCQNCGGYELQPLAQTGRLDLDPATGIAFRLARVA